MIRTYIRVATAVHRGLHAHAPSNKLLDLLRTRRGLKWAAPAAGVLVPGCLYGANLLTTQIEKDASGWLNLLVLVLCWDALKFAAMAVISHPLLMRAWINEYRARRFARHEGYSPNRELGPWATCG